jgi:hypothetical protein
MATVAIGDQPENVSAAGMRRSFLVKLGSWNKFHQRRCRFRCRIGCLDAALPELFIMPSLQASQDKKTRRRDWYPAAASDDRKSSSGAG